jgi:formylglycine-generating enzyme required for sulfatase activity/serine/threonine protein kinase
VPDSTNPSHSPHHAEPANGSDTGRTLEETGEVADPSSADPELREGGRPVPEYALVKKLGEGGCGQVWKARDDNGFEVALKFHRLDTRAGVGELRALEVMRNVRHAQVLPMFRAWQAGNWLILALELGDKTLYQRLGEPGQGGQPGIPREELLQYMLDAARGLDYLHTLNIQHRDVKPQNLLLVGGSLKVADFGLAKLLEHNLASNSGSLTVAYAAPEQFQGRVSAHSDQYSLAVSYCQLRGGRLPFRGSQHELVYGHLHGEPDLSMLPEAERPAVARALAKEPEQRWQSCREFVDALNKSATVSGVPVPRTPLCATEQRHSQETLSEHRPRLRVPKLPRRWMLGVLAAVVLAFGTVVLWPQKQNPPVPALSVGWLGSFTITAGDQITLPVRIRRDNCPDWATLDVSGLPPGVQVSAKSDAPEGSDPRITLTADIDADGADTLVWVTARTGDRPGAVWFSARAGEVRGEGSFRLLLKPAKRVPAPIDCTRGDGLPAAKMRRAQKEWARYLNRPVEETVEVGHGVKMTFVLVPPGKFRMGSPDDEVGRSQDEVEHRVVLTEPFDLGKYEVTQAQYKALTGKEPSKFKGFGDLPVEQVSWEEACDFGIALTKRLADGHFYRLPTEAQWEYACRGGRPSSLPFGVGDGWTFSSRQANFNGNYPYGSAAKGDWLQKTCKVGSYAANALGLCDMHGNVWEWCADTFGRYSTGEVTTPRGPAEGPFRVIRGGGWLSNGGHCRAANRNRDGPGDRNDDLGLRLARSIPSGGE